MFRLFFLLEELKEKISTADKENLTKLVAELRTALVSDDVDKIQEAKKELEQASWKVSQQAYNSSAGDSNDSSSDQQSEEKKQEEEKK